MSGLENLIWPFHFIRPWWLLALPIVATIWILVRNRDGSRQNQKLQIAPHLLSALTVNRSKQRQIRPIDVTAVALLFAAVAAAGPTWRQLPNPFFAETSPLVVALEVSGTMLANDIQPLERKLVRVVA